MNQPTDIKHLIGVFATHLQESGKSPHTVIAYKKDLEQFGGFLLGKNKTLITEVTKDDIEEFLQKLLNENYTKKSASRKLNSIRTFYRFLKGEEVIQNSPAFDVRHPKYVSAPPKILSKIEYRALRDFAKEDSRTYAMVELLLQTGMRISELADLKNSDVKDDEIKIANRMVPLNNAVKKALDEYMKARPEHEDDHLFVTKSGKALLVRNIRSVLMRCFREIGIPTAKVQDLRNTFIAYQLQSGGSISYIARVVGHKRILSTEKYLGLVPETSDKKEKLGEL